MTDPHNPAAQNPSGGDAAPATPPAPPAYGEYATPPAAPAYGEYAPTAPAGPPAPDANAYQQPAYAQAPAYAPGAPAPGAAVPGKTLGIVAFVLSFFVQLIALILGIVALVQSKKAWSQQRLRARRHHHQRRPDGDRRDSRGDLHPHLHRVDQRGHGMRERPQRDGRGVRPAAELPAAAGAVRPLSGRRQPRMRQCVVSAPMPSTPTVTVERSRRKICGSRE